MLTLAHSGKTSLRVRPAVRVTLWRSVAADIDAAVERGVKRSPVCRRNQGHAERGYATSRRRPVSTS